MGRGSIFPIDHAICDLQLMERTGHGVRAEAEKSKNVGDALQREHDAARRLRGGFSGTDRLEQIDFLILATLQIESCTFGQDGGYLGGALDGIPIEIVN